jgi:hypothetical protein
MKKIKIIRVEGAPVVAFLRAGGGSAKFDVNKDSFELDPVQAMRAVQTGSFAYEPGSEFAKGHEARVTRQQQEEAQNVLKGLYHAHVSTSRLAGEEPLRFPDFVKRVTESAKKKKKPASGEAAPK